MGQGEGRGRGGREEEWREETRGEQEEEQEEDSKIKKDHSSVGTAVSATYSIRKSWFSDLIVQ